jgi:2-polyprenyl-6-hydroxyphenyl methylase/3-demethylubiquinone-9 3-methyltransferase
MTTVSTNVDAHEVDKFENTASQWWDPRGPFRPLHDLNPVRLNYVAARAPLSGRRVLDVGCGGGLLSEAMASAGAQVTGIDAAAASLDVARQHAQQSGLNIDYRHAQAEELAVTHAGSFDTLTCMELLEHVPDPSALIAACAVLLRPGGDVFFSTVNRTATAYLLGVLGAEYVLGLLPRGTHDYRRFIRPSELAAWARLAGLEVLDVTGMAYNPLTRHVRLTRSVGVNYLVHCRKSG